jgi:hypothetical protein
VDPEYRKMMIWVAVAFVASIIAAFVIVEWTMRVFAE